jgi:SET domain-containing protein
VGKIATRNSNIHGKGVFAEEEFRAGDSIIDWSSSAEFLTNQEIEALPDDERKYLSFLNGRNILFNPPARFVNHSCNPNARGMKGHDVAIRHIAQGEEITVDYDLERVPGLTLQCNCGASGCRGFLKVDT